MLALLKAGFPPAAIYEMQEADAEVYVSIMNDLLMSGAPGSRKYVVKRDGKKELSKHKSR